MITHEEAARLQVPLSAVPGLHPVGLPVLFRHESWLVTRLVVTRGVTRAAEIDQIRGTERIGAVPFGGLSCDLADDGTADRIARWVAERMGLEPGCTAPTWVFDGGWQVVSGGSLAMFDHISSLGDLDPDDDRRLPSGARLVDRRALALVARHVGASRSERRRSSPSRGLTEEATHPG